MYIKYNILYNNCISIISTTTNYISVNLHFFTTCLVFQFPVFIPCYRCAKFSHYGLSRGARAVLIAIWSRSIMEGKEALRRGKNIRKMLVLSGVAISQC